LPFIVPNLRLGELVGIVNANEPFFNDFVAYLKSAGYADVHAFVAESSDAKATRTILGFLTRDSDCRLYDGLGRPYTDLRRARWSFLAWMFRDAPNQRLQPLLSQIPGANADEQRANLLNLLRKYVAPLFPAKEKWTWPVISEVMLARLEGSRRALKGTLFEGVVRTTLNGLFTAKGLKLQIGDKEVRLSDETYDVEVRGKNGRILIPVKTRETMGGGHALLFTRDIHKSISVAHENGFECIPIVIAESWGGNLEALACKHHIYIKANPNQATEITPLLEKALKDLLFAFREIA
jgi:hypothetical protein